ncbi:MAG TPA: DUF2281 domain-containing protein [bacterium]|nr:DUF2281 domain-containing protein [bacterium]
MKSLEELVKELPPDLRDEVRDFAEFVLEKNQAAKGKKKGRKLKLTWAGGLREYRDKYTSIELQKKALEWWGD